MKIENASQRKSIIARQISQAMEEKGISRSQLAKLMGKTPPYVTRWLSGKHNFTSDTLAELSRVLGVNITGVNAKTEYNLSESGMSMVMDSGSSAVLSIEPSLKEAVLRRAYSLGKSVNDYVNGLIRTDIGSYLSLPKVKVSATPTGKVRKYAGMLGGTPVSDDDKFDRIWNR